MKNQTCKLNYKLLFAAVIMCCLSFIMLMPLGTAAADTEPITIGVDVWGHDFNYALEAQQDTGVRDLKLTTNMTLNNAWLTTDANTVYNSDLALFANLMCANVFTHTYVVQSGTTSGYSDMNLLRAFGFTDVSRCYIPQENWNLDNDTSYMLCGHKTVTIGAKSYNVFICVVKATGTDAEWMSNLDIGDNSQDYFVQTGQHPDWNDKKSHKGISVAAGRCQAALDKYIQRYTVTGYENTMLLTGHSRGAGIANLMGAYYESKADIKSYTYTFNCPLVTTDTSKTCKTIFNIINTDDVVSMLPFKEWGFTRYGKDISSSVMNNSDMLTMVNSHLKVEGGYGKISDTMVNTVTTAFMTILPQRSYLYSYKRNISYLGINRETDKKTLQGLLNYFDINEFFDLDNETYSYGFITKILGQLMGNREQLDDPELSNKLTTLLKYIDLNDLVKIYPYVNTITGDTQSFNKATYPHMLLSTYAILSTLPQNHICDMNAESVILTPSCTEEGTKAIICSQCKHVVKTESIPASGHDWDKGVVTKEPTTTNTGIIIYTCTRCKTTKAEILPKLDPKSTPTPDSSTNPQPVPKANFVDVKAGAYYYDAVNWAVAKNITAGTSATTFSPDKPCTRSQIVTFLWRAANKPKASSDYNPFKDVKKDAYYYDAVLWAVEKGITAGKDATHFAPDDTCTRAQAMSFIWRYAGKPNASGTNPFKDVKSSAYYYSPVLWAVANGITAGVDTTHFAPNQTCTRGQIVTFLWRYLK